ncbi:MAG TPA: hypothetical protein VGS22_07020 [Thermoanaerobaculia bacterium]|jgi:tRNA nucleotidyltransferase/poly(A) polymerase|nr:hypothetical protein [Thermoanaerobaculia bacterium]
MPSVHLSSSWLALLAIPAVSQLAEIAGATPCHLVGGAIRDAALGREVHDLDAVVDGHGEEIARGLAARLPARFVPLGGKEFPAFRLVAADLELDLWDRSGTSLKEDLARRDLTINAIAFDLRTQETVDPFGGLADLERRLLRAVTSKSFAGDPLRLLRLARLAVQLPGFVPVPETLVLARASASALPTVAGERIRDELGRIVGSSRAAVGVKILAEVGIYPGLWTYRLGEIVPFGRVIDRLEVYETVGQELEEATGSAEESTRTAGRWALLFAELREPGGKAESALPRFVDRGYLTKPQAQQVTRLLALSELPDAEADRRLFLYRLGPDLWLTALAFIAARGAASAEKVRSLAELARREGSTIFDPPRLLSSEQIRALTGLPAGPELGRLLAALRKAQARGEVKTATEAETWTRSQVVPH